jgi:hypothetical protein
MENKKIKIKKIKIKVLTELKKSKEIIIKVERENVYLYI